MVMHERINKYDNLKGFAIILIVLGHLPGLLSPAFDHRFIYIIHLPIFFFVSGYFSKIGPDEPIKSFKRLLLPYIIFSIIWKLYSNLVFGIPAGRLFIEPGGALWFLISLFTMKMVLPIMDRFRYPILISIICALLIGVINIPGNLLGITRTFIYMPIFLIGFYYNDYKAYLSANYEKLFSFLRKGSVKYLCFALIVIACVLVAFTFPAKIILLQHPYSKSFLTDMLLKFIVITLGILFALNFNSIMTNKKCFLTKIGKNSMAIYLLHPYFAKYIIKPFINNTFHNGIVLAAVVIFFVALLVFVLSRDFVSNALNKLFDVIFNILVGKNRLANSN